MPGLYEALRSREREYLARHQRFSEHYPQYGDTFNRRLLDALEAGHSVAVQGRTLNGGWSVPHVPLRREQAFDWFAVTQQDRIVRTESPQDDA